jgi:hypothetical protein
VRETGQFRSVGLRPQSKAKLSLPIAFRLLAALELLPASGAATKT